MGLPHLDDLGIGLVCALAGFLAAELANWLRRRIDSRKKRKDGLASVVAGLADHLSGMARAFKAREVPHTDGRAFKSSLKEFEKDILPHLEPDMRLTFDRLAEISYNADEVDTHLYELKTLKTLKPEKRARLDEWVLTAERMSGDLQVVARRLRLKGI